MNTLSSSSRGARLPLGFIERQDRSEQRSGNGPVKPGPVICKAWMPMRFVAARTRLPTRLDLTVSCIEKMTCSSLYRDESVQTNRPNSSRLIAPHCPWSSASERPNNRSNRRRERVAHLHDGTQHHRASGITFAQACAIRRSERKRVPIYSYQLRVVRRNRPLARALRGASVVRRHRQPGDMQAEPVMGRGDSSGTPTASQGRAADRTATEISINGDGRWNEALSACAANP